MATVRERRERGELGTDSSSVMSVRQKRMANKYGTPEQRAGSAIARQSAETQQIARDKERSRQGTQLMADAGFSYADQSKRFKEFDSGIKATAAKQQAIEDAKPTYRERVSERLEKITPILRPLAAVPASIAEFTEPAQPFFEAAYTPGGAPAAVAALTRGAAYGIGKAIPALSRSAGGRVAQTALTEATVGAPLGVSNVLARDAQATPQEIAEGALWGAGGGALLGGAGRGGKELLQAGARSVGRKLEDLTGTQLQALRSLERVDKAPRYAGDLRLDTKAQNVSRIMEKIRGDVTQAMTPPLENDKALRDWVKPILGNPSNKELAKLTYDDLVEIAEEARRGMNTYDTAVRIANARGINLEQAFEQAPSIRARLSQDASRRAYGAPTPELPSVSRPIVNEPVSRITPPEVTPRQIPDYGDMSLPSAPQVEPQPVRLRYMRDDQLNVGPVDDGEEIFQAIQQPRIRDRVYSYLDEAEKSARERIKSRRGRLSSIPIDEWGDYAVIGAAKLGKGTIKLADWTEEMVREFGEEFRKNAPKVYNQSREILRNQERIASKEGQDAKIFNEKNIGNVSTFRSKVSRDAKKRGTNLSQKIENARSSFEDDVIAFEGLEKRVTGKPPASAEKSLYKSARLYKGVSEKSAQIINDRMSPIMKNVEDAGYKPEDIGDYMLAMHARDVNNAGYKSGFTNKEINDTIQKYKNIPLMEQARQELVKISDDMLDELVNSQMLRADLRDVLRERWKNYTPLFRSFDDDPETFGRGLSQSLATIGDPIHKLKGSERAVIDPLENMIKNIFKTVGAAERNKVRLQLSRLAKLDTNEEYIRKLGEGEGAGNKNVISVRENGESVKYEIEPEVFRAFNNLDQESSNTLINILSKPASILRAGATLTPEFAARNPFRDILQAYVTSESGFNPITDFAAGLFQTITKGKYYKGWIDNLGAYGNILSQDRNAHREALESILKQPITDKFINVVNGKALIRLLRSISDTTESATKVGEYRKAIKKGVTPQEAAYRARDLMDFARSGSAIRPANKIIAFLNANIQGKSKLLRAIRKNPVRTTTRMITGITIPTVGIYANNHLFANETQRQTIDEAPDWLKNSFWLLAIPGTDYVARIPKPFDIAPIFANLPERALDYMVRSNPIEFGEWAKQSLGASALPMQISGLLPVIEGMSGYSFFREGDIVPLREQGFQRKDQYDPVRTSEVAKLLASGMSQITGDRGPFKNFSSPRTMENTIKGITAGLGTYATDAIDAILKVTGAIERPEAPEKRIEQRPFIRSFLVDPLGSTKPMDEMYKEKETLTKEESSRQLRGETFTKIGRKKIYLPEDKANRLNQLTEATDDISDINKIIREIESDESKSAKQKRNEIEPLLAERNKLSREVMGK